MAKQIKVEGVIHSFPDDATDDEINQALGGSQQNQISMQEHPEEDFDESYVSKLPRNIAAGFASMGHNILNFPHNEVQNLQDKLKQLGGSFNKWKSSHGSKYGGDNEKQGVFDLASHIPYQQEHNFAQMLGQKGEGTLADKLTQGFVEHAPEILTVGSLAKQAVKKLPALSSKSILKQMSGHKAAEMEQAAQNFGSLWKDAEKAGIKEAKPTTSAIKHLSEIIPNVTRKERGKMEKYLIQPSLQNAHDAQSELGYLIRSLEKKHKIDRLPPSERDLLHNAQDAQEEIRHSIFHGHPELDVRYREARQAYKEKAVPYNRLKQLSEFETNEIRPKSAIRQLKGDEKFMIQLAKRYPGLKLHTAESKDSLKSLLSAMKMGSLNKFIK